MAARGPAGTRGGSTRFAQFKLVLLGTLPIFGEVKHYLTVHLRRICGWKGTSRLRGGFVSMLTYEKSSLVLRFVKVSQLSQNILYDLF